MSSVEYLAQRIRVFYSGNNPDRINDHRVVTMDPDFFKFEITEQGLAEGILEEDLNSIRVIWFQCCVIKIIVFENRDFDKEISVAFSIITLVFLCFVSYLFLMLPVESSIYLLMPLIQMRKKNSNI